MSAPERGEPVYVYMSEDAALYEHRLDQRMSALLEANTYGRIWTQQFGTPHISFERILDDEVQNYVATIGGQSIHLDDNPDWWDTTRP